ncbi:MAG: DUF4405 domain-containing protein [Bacteroides sp.]|nr:DUF4405 domain-containing protein [Bacteroides sp.]
MLKSKMPVNIVIDLAMLVAMALVSISGFILEVVIPSRHAVRFQGADSWCSHLCGLGRHGWGDIHLWAGVALLVLLAAHILLHLNIVSAFFKKRCPNRTLQMVLYVFLLMLLLITIVPWFYMFH